MIHLSFPEVTHRFLYPGTKVYMNELTWIWITMVVQVYVEGLRRWKDGCGVLEFLDFSVCVLLCLPFVFSFWWGEGCWGEYWKLFSLFVLMASSIINTIFSYLMHVWLIFLLLWIGTLTFTLSVSQRDMYCECWKVILCVSSVQLHEWWFFPEPSVNSCVEIWFFSACVQQFLTVVSPYSHDSHETKKKINQK